MKVEIITGINCGRCKRLHSLLPSDARIHYIDASSPVANAVLAYHELINTPVSLPLVIIDDIIQEAPSMAVLADVIKEELACQ